MTTSISTLNVTCLAIGDPHFMTSNVKDTEEYINKLTSLTKSLKPTFIVILGDLLHKHEKIDVSPFNMAQKLIEQLSKHAPTFLIIWNAFLYLDEKSFDIVFFQDFSK